MATLPLAPVGLWRSLVARSVRVGEVAGSNPVSPTIRSPADQFVLAATDGNRTRAEALLAAHPDIERDRWARLVLGRDWEGDPDAPGGPRGWAPLLYVCHSCLGTAALAAELLRRGADPNASFRNEYGRMSALYGAAGVVPDPERTRLLLEAGASPDDGESLYHATEAADPACLALLLAHGASPAGTNALAHALDEQRGEHVRLLLDAGADPNEGALLAHAVRLGGADPGRPAGTAGLGARRGGDRLQRGRGGFTGGHAAAPRRLGGNPDVVRGLLAAGADPGREIETGTPLGWAAHGSGAHALAGRDYPAVAEALTEAGNPVEPGLVAVAQGPLYEWLEGHSAPDG